MLWRSDIAHAQAQAYACRSVVSYMVHVSSTCSTCEQEQRQTPNQYTTITYKAPNSVKVIFAADMKMKRMLIGYQSSAACYCFCPMCLVTRHDIQPGRIHSPFISETYFKNKRNSRSSFTPQQQHKISCTHCFCKRHMAIYQLPRTMEIVSIPLSWQQKCIIILAVLPLHILLDAFVMR